MAAFFDGVFQEDLIKTYFCQKKQVQILEILERHITVDDEIRRFVQHKTHTETHPKGTLLTRQNQYSRKIYFMEEGLARSFYFENGKDITTNFYTEGKILGNVDSIFTGVPTRYNFEILEESTLVSCNYQELEALCAVSLPAANFSRYILGNLMTQTLARLTSLQHMTAREKYEQLLEENPGIILRAPLGMIATYLGISQETLSRIRSEK